MSVNRINLMSPVRMSKNVSVERQTPKTDFGTRLKAGLETAAAAVGAGVTVAAPFIPGGAMLSAAVSSIGSGPTGSLNTTVGPGGVTVGNSLGAVGVNPGGSASTAINNSLAGMQNENLRMMEIQIAMQRENTVFSTLSNILKVRHDTQKNSIGNIR